MNSAAATPITVAQPVRCCGPDGLKRAALEGFTFTTPDGGYFIWVTLPERIDTTALLAQADAHHVAFIPGQRLCVDGRGRHCLRLAFSLMKPDQLNQGAQRLGALIATQL